MWGASSSKCSFLATSYSGLFYRDVFETAKIFLKLVLRRPISFVLIRLDSVIHHLMHEENGAIPN